MRAISRQKKLARGHRMGNKMDKVQILFPKSLFLTVTTYSPCRTGYRMGSTLSISNKMDKVQTGSMALSGLCQDGQGPDFISFGTSVSTMEGTAWTLSIQPFVQL
jgi:hypothetical protein